MLLETNFLLCLLVGFAQTTDFTKFKSRKNAKLRDHDIMKTKTATSVTICANICAIETSFSCQTFSWSNSVCLISDRIRINEYDGDLATNNEWITCCRVTYPVFMVQGVNGVNSLTFPEGQAECEERGTTVASREDLLAARGMGYDICVCGWLSDGTGGFVVQTHDPDCTFEFHTGVIDWCSGTMDVYCKV